MNINFMWAALTFMVMSVAHCEYKTQEVRYKYKCSSENL